MTLLSAFTAAVVVPAVGLAVVAVSSASSSAGTSPSPSSVSHTSAVSGSASHTSAVSGSASRTSAARSSAARGLAARSSAARGSASRGLASRSSASRGSAADIVLPRTFPPDQPGGSDGPGATGQVWRWPLFPIPDVIRGFQLGPAPWSPGHRGVDLAAAPGALVRAPADGVVRYSAVLAGVPVLTIDHGRGLVSSFEPAIGRLPVGTVVKQGDVVAVLAAGQNHCLPASCLHWGVRRNGIYIDPLSLLPGRRGPAVLIPLLS